MRHFIIAFAILFPILTSGCNTMAGAGEDISKGGEKIEHSAEEHKDY